MIILNNCMWLINNYLLFRALKYLVYQFYKFWITESKFLHSYSPSFYPGYNDTKVLVISDNSGYYVIQKYSPDSNPHVLKYTFSSPTNQHYRLSNQVVYSYATLMISDTELFWISKINSSPFNAAFVKLTFTNSSADWAKQMSCSSSWGVGFSGSLLSADKSKLYTLVSYSQTTTNMYFTVFNTSDGTVLGNKYKSSSAWSSSGGYGAVLSGDNVVATFRCASWYLLVYSILTDSFTFKLFSGSDLYDWALENWSNR